MKYIIAPNSVVEDDATIGDGTKVWYFSHVCKGAKIGKNCNIGDYVYVGNKVIIGNDCKIANDVALYEGVIIKDRVFVGSHVSFTNVRKPSASKRAKKFLDTIIDDDVTIGSNATIVGGIKIGKGAIVAEGAVVIGDVPSGMFVAGNPAKKKKFLTEEQTHDDK